MVGRPEYPEPSPVATDGEEAAVGGVDRSALASHVASGGCFWREKENSVSSRTFSATCARRVARSF